MASTCSLWVLDRTLCKGFYPAPTRVTLRGQAKEPCMVLLSTFHSKSVPVMGECEELGESCTNAIQTL